MTDRQLRRIRTRPQIFRRFDLLGSLDNLIKPRQSGDEPHHRDKPRRARMCGNKVVDRRVAVDARRILDVAAVRVLTALAKPCTGFIGPRIVVEHGQFDNARRQFKIGIADLRLDLLERAQHLVGMDHIGIETYQIGGVRGTNLGDPWNTPVLQLLADCHALEERLKRHSLVDFGEDMLVRTEGITDAAHAYLRPSSLGPAPTAPAPLAIAPRNPYRTWPPALPAIERDVYAG